MGPAPPPTPTLTPRGDATPVYPMDTNGNPVAWPQDANGNYLALTEDADPALIAYAKAWDKVLPYCDELPPKPERVGPTATPSPPVPGVNVRCKSRSRKVNMLRLGGPAPVPVPVPIDAAPSQPLPPEPMVEDDDPGGEGPVPQVPRDASGKDSDPALIDYANQASESLPNCEDLPKETPKPGLTAAPSGPSTFGSPGEPGNVRCGSSGEVTLTPKGGPTPNE